MHHLITPSDASGFWQRLAALVASHIPLKEKYALGYALLNDVCDILTLGNGIVYNDLYTKLQAVCRSAGYALAPIDHFRWRAWRVMKGKGEPEATIFIQDAKALADALAVFMRQPIPPALRRLLPDQPVSDEKPQDRVWMSRRRHLRLQATDKDARFIYARAREEGNGRVLRVDYLTNEQTRAAGAAIRALDSFNVLSFQLQDDLITPQMIVIDPDFLIDITQLASTIQEYGQSAFLYLLRQFEPMKSAKALLMGNFANAFLDDCVNDPQTTFEQSFRKALIDNILAFTSLRLGEEKAALFKAEARVQFSHIQSTVQTLAAERKGRGLDTYLEPSFFCEPLGVQGRFDLLLSDKSMVVELKSGKKDEFRKAPKPEHRLQMLLYKEVLYQMFGLPRNQVQGRLLYSRYPELIEQRSVEALISNAMLVRNNIMLLHRSLREGKVAPLLMTLTPDRLNQNQAHSVLWKDYQRPKLEELLLPLRQMDPLTAAYFNTFLTFIAREQHYAKAGTGTLGSARSMAALWNEADDVKIDNGEMLIGMRVKQLHGEGGIEAVTFELTNKRSDVVPNFREGDIVVVYEKNEAADSVGNKQVVRGTVESLDEGSVKVRLRHVQRNEKVLARSACFALEHDYMDMSFGSMYKALYALLTTEPQRRQLLLGQRLPSYDESEELSGDYATPQFNDIVLRAKQADDYFLLVGPPGTGKTSVAMKALVEEYLSEGSNLLLMAFTNRAVDEICAMLDTIAPRMDYVRLGSELSCGERYRSHLLRTRAEQMADPQEMASMVRRTQVFVATTSSAANATDLFELKHFDVAIIDEASQILEPQIIGILCAMTQGSPVVGKFIMIGDHKQLPAVVMQPEWMTEVGDASLQSIGLTDCRNSLFERLHTLAGNNPAFVAMLDHQGRMHPAIADFSSSVFYEGKLSPVPLQHQQEELSDYGLEGQSPFIHFIATARMAFFPSLLPKQPGGKCNETEANIIAEIVMGVCQVARIRGEAFEPDMRIGIIVPFRKQIALVREKLRRLRVNGCERLTIDTVERFQGSQRDIIIYGTTVTQTYELAMISQEVRCQGVTVDRKLNVAVTRARKQCFVVGYEPLLRQTHSYARLIDYADKL